MQKNTPHLSERNLQMIYAVGRRKFQSSHQIRRDFYPHATHETATQRLTELHRLGFLSPNSFREAPGFRHGEERKVGLKDQQPFLLIHFVI